MMKKEIFRKEFLAKGKRSKVYKAIFKNKKVAVKIFTTQDAKARSKKEAYFISLLNKKGIGPKIILQKDNYIIYKLIEGPRFIDWLDLSEKKKIIIVILKILDNCFKMDKLGINKLEFQHPKKHILIEKNKPIFIDFERCYYTNKPKNLTQFCQYITSKNISLILKKKGIKVDKKKLIKLLRNYKTNRNSSIKNIINFVKYS